MVKPKTNLLCILHQRRKNVEVRPTEDCKNTLQDHLQWLRIVMATETKKRH